MFDLTHPKAVCIACKILGFGICPSCCLQPQHWIFSWPVFHPCLSGIWYACSCRGMPHEFSPSCFVWGFVAERLCAHTKLLMEAWWKRFFLLLLFGEQKNLCSVFWVHVLFKRCTSALIQDPYSIPLELIGPVHLKSSVHDYLKGSTSTKFQRNSRKISISPIFFAMPTNKLAFLLHGLHQSMKQNWRL